MDIKTIELIINTKLDIFMGKLNKKIEESSDAKGVFILTTAGISLIIIITIIFKIILSPIQYIIRESLL